MTAKGWKTKADTGVVGEGEKGPFSSLFWASRCSDCTATEQRAMGAGRNLSGCTPGSNGHLLSFFIGGVTETSPPLAAVGPDPA